MARSGVERRQQRREDRRARREFGEVARDAIRQGHAAGQLTDEQAQAFIAATNRPRHLEQIRSSFVQDLSEAKGGPQQLQAADFLGKLDFDTLLPALTAFFPKLASLGKYAGLFREIIKLFRSEKAATA
jgi:hypothetical protein